MSHLTTNMWSDVYLTERVTMKIYNEGTMKTHHQLFNLHLEPDENTKESINGAPPPHGTMQSDVRRE